MTDKHKIAWLLYTLGVTVGTLTISANDATGGGMFLTGGLVLAAFLVALS